MSSFPRVEDGWLYLDEHTRLCAYHYDGKSWTEVQTRSAARGSSWHDSEGYAKLDALSKFVKPLLIEQGAVRGAR